MPTRPAANETPVPGPAPRWTRALLLATALPLAVHLLLFQLNVPLGCPGRFVYLYSPIYVMRLERLPSFVPAGALLALGVYLAARSETREDTPSTKPPTSRKLTRWSGHLSALLGLVLLAVAAYRAPPQHLSQHYFNANSPSHDGAFVEEAQQITDLRTYLRDFPARARSAPAELRGTRIISNPPGATLLAYGLDRLRLTLPSLGAYAGEGIRAGIGDDTLYSRLRPQAELSILFLWTLTALWALSGVTLYAAGRALLPTAPAWTYAIVCVLTPATLLFVPGKDPAQLLTASIPLGLWLLAWRRGRSWAAALAGATLVLTCLASLAHVWLAAIVFGATLWATWGECGRTRDFSALRRLLLRVLLPAATAAVLVAGLLGLLCDLNLVASLRAVAQSQAEVTRGPHAMPFMWQTLGAPLFVLFSGPALWCVLAWSMAGHTPPPAALAPSTAYDRRFANALLLGTVAVLVGTVGFTNVETPRLWIPFVPLLMLGAFVRLNTRVGRRVPSLATWLAALIAVQVCVSALQWSLMDARESETRLVEQAFFDRPAQ